MNTSPLRAPGHSEETIRSLRTRRRDMEWPESLLARTGSDHHFVPRLLKAIPKMAAAASEITQSSIRQGYCSAESGDPAPTMLSLFSTSRFASAPSRLTHTNQR